MLIVSDELKNAFMKDERTIYVRIKIGSRTFDNDNVISVDYDAGSLSGEIFAIGSTYSNSIKITFSELVEGLKELDEVTYEIGIKLPSGTIEYVPMGVFVINDAIEMDRNNNKTTIECMDRMVMMGGAYVSSLNYPAAIREVALEIANKSGIQVSDTFDRLSADVIAKPEGYTYREAIGLIAQFEAGFATFNRYGKLEIRTLSDPNFSIPPDNYFSKGLVKNEVFFRLGGISCTTDESGDAVIQSGNSTGNQIVLENRVMTKVLLDKIYQKIQTINYYPFSLSWQGNPVLEAGDWVEVEDLKGNKFKTPNLSYSLSFNGGLSAKSSAETATQSDTTYQYKSPLQQKIEWIHARIDAAGGNVVYEGIDEPANPKEGDLWFKIIGPDKEILIYKKRADGSLFWEPQISTADIDKVAKEVGAIIKQADEDRQATEQKFDQAVTDAKAYTEKKANEFDTKFETETGAIRNEVTAGYTNAITVGKEYTDVKSAEFDAQLIVVKNDLVNTVLKADAAVLKADKAIEDAGFMRIDLNTTKQNAIDALTKAQTATDNLNTLSFSVDELTKTVGFKAEKTTVDAVTKQVNQHELSIAANAREIDLRMTSTQVDSLVSAKGYVNQAQLTATSTQWNLALAQVSSDLSDLEIGGRNLVIRNTELLNRYLTGAETYPNANTVIAGSSTMKELINVTPGENLMFTKISSGDNYWRVSWLNSSKVYVSRFVNTSNKFLMTVPSGVVYMWVSYPTGSNPKVERGTKATDWSPAPEDMATLEQFTTIDATVKGLQTTVGNKADETKVTQLANQWTQTTALVNGHTGQISNLGEQINLRVTSSQVTEAILVDKTIKDTRNDNQIPQWYTTVYPKQEVREFKLRTVVGVPGSSTYVQVTTKVPWTGGTSGGVPVQVAESNDGTYQRSSNATMSAWLAWDKIAEAGKLISQINISTEGLLLQGKRIQLDGDVTMTTTFVETMKAKSLEAVYADIATLKTKVLTADVITSVHLKVDNALIDKLTVNVAVVNYLFTKQAIIDNLKVKSLEAIYADIATLKTKLLTADVITSVHIKSDAALIDKLFVTDANINRLTAKAAFITSVKAIDIAADRITAGTLNAALVNIINLNANRIATGTITGANSDWNLNTGIQAFINPATGDNLILSQGAIQFQNGGQVRLLEYTAEGLKLSAGPGNTGTSLNASLHLNGGVSYVQFNNRAGTVNNGRIQMTSDSATIQIPNGAFLAIRDRSNLQAGISVNYVTTEHNTGYTIQMAGDSIKTPRAGNRNIYIAPNGTGSVVAGEASGTRYNMVASDFVKQSSRSTKTNIIPLESGLDNIRQLKPVSYNKIDKLNQGIFEIEKGFIAEDSLMVATVDGKGIYDSHITAYLVKAVQELDVRTMSETDLLKEKVRILEEKIQKLESAA